MSPTFALRYLLRAASRRKGRFVLGALGVFVGIALMTAIQAGLDSLSLAYIDFATITAGKADAMVMPRFANPMEPRFFDPEPALRAAGSVEGVAGCVPAVLWGVFLTAGKTRDGAVVGADLAGKAGRALADFPIREGSPEFERGKLPARDLAAGECLLSDPLAEKLGLHPGDGVRLAPSGAAGDDGGEEFEVVARVRAARDIPGLGEEFCVVPPAAAAKLGGAQGAPASARVRGRSTGYTAMVGADPPAVREMDLGALLVEKQTASGPPVGPWEAPIERGECLVSETMAERFGVEAGDTITLQGLRPPIGLGAAKKYKVAAVVVQRGMFPDFIRGFLVLGRQEASELAGQPGKVSFLSVSFADRRRLYDARDIHKSVLRARAVGERLQESLGLKYTVSMPKAMVLDLRESFTSLLRGIFTLFGAVALAIAAILIYSLLSISVEERVRENAILRTLGARKGFVMATVVGEGALLCLAGSGFGVLGGIGLTWVAARVGTAFARSEGFPLEIPLFVNPSSIAIALAAGVLVALASSALPAVRSVRATVIEALNAYRAPPSPVKLVRERALNVRLMLAGAVITAFMLFFTVLFPRALASGDPTILAVLFGLVLLTLLVGMVLLSLGAEPLIERGVSFLLRPVLGKAAALSERNLARYRRRNTATSLIFSLSVALVLFVASMATILFRQAGQLARFMNGADVRVETYVNPRVDIEEELRRHEGVEAVARVDVGHLTEGTSAPRYRVSVVMGDLAGIRWARVRAYGAGPDLLDALYVEDLRMREGDLSVFRELVGDAGEGGTGTVILPGSVASHLSVGVGSLVKIRGTVGTRRADRILRVAAVTDKMPGFPEFFSGAGRARGAGILVSHELFRALLGKDIEERLETPPGEGDEEGDEGDEEDADGFRVPTAKWRALYLAKLKPGAEGVGRRIRERLGWARMGIEIRDTAEDVKNAMKLYYSTQILFTAILFLSVAIALFGLLASMYTTVLERRREVVILKALGMRRADLLRMFAGETTSLLLTAGTLGTLTGYVVAYILVQQQTAIAELPTPFTVPLLPIAGMVAVSLVMGLLGAWLPARSLLRKSPAEILRES